MPSVINSDNGVISGTSGLKTSGSNDGLLDFQSNGTRIAGITTSAFQVGTDNISAVNSMGFRNRIINGDMRIAQRGTGSITADTTSQFPVDRFKCNGSTSGKFTAQQNAGSVTLPAGFTNYLGATSSSAYSVPTGEAYSISHTIEGFNVADLGWGAAGAQSVTLSFWVRSSLTGTFGGVIRNSANNRAYPYTYTISAANTWEQKTVTIAGDTSGTWLTNNGEGILIIFSLGAGTSLLGTAGAWTGTSNIFGATGQTNVVATNGATFYITGVQLEAGSVATPFERRDYGRELIMCQRYYESYYFRNTTYGMGSGTSTVMNVPIKVTKRATPTTTIGSDPDGWTNNFPSASATNYNADSLAIVSTGATSSVVRYGAILSFSAEL